MCECGNDRILDGYERCHACESKAQQTEGLNELIRDIATLPARMRT
jgi:hypothetical protein